MNVKALIISWIINLIKVEESKEYQEYKSLIVDKLVVGNILNPGRQVYIDNRSVDKSNRPPHQSAPELVGAVQERSWTCTSRVHHCKKVEWESGSQHPLTKWVLGCEEDTVFCQGCWASSINKRCKVSCQESWRLPIYWPGVSTLAEWKLGVKNNWNRLVMDIMHLGSECFQTLIDCNLSWFAIWWPHCWEDSTSVTNQLTSIFFKCDPLTEILTDNDTGFPCGHSENSSLTEVWSFNFNVLMYWPGMM